MAGSPFKVIVIGGGSVGLVAAHALHASNIDYVVLEKRIDSVSTAGAGTIIHADAARVLHQLGLLDTFMNTTNVLRFKENRLASGKVLEKLPLFAYFHELHGYEPMAFSRAEIVKILYDQLPNREKRIKTSCEVIDIETHPDKVRVVLADGTVEEGSIVLGCDGVNSRVREIVERPIFSKDPSYVPRQALYKAVVGRATLKGLEKVPSDVFWEVRSSGWAIQVARTREWITFGVSESLTKPSTERRKYSDQEAEKFMARIEHVPIFEDVTMGDIWDNTEWSRMFDIREGISKSWYSDRIALAGDAAASFSYLSGLGFNNGVQCVVTLVNALNDALCVKPNPSADAITQAFQRYQQTSFPTTEKAIETSKLIAALPHWKTWFIWIMDRWIMQYFDKRAIIIKGHSNIFRQGHLLNSLPTKGLKRGELSWKYDV